MCAVEIVFFYLLKLFPACKTDELRPLANDDDDSFEAEGTKCETSLSDWLRFGRLSNEFLNDAARESLGRFVIIVLFMQ